MAEGGVSRELRTEPESEMIALSDLNLRTLIAELLLKRRERREPSEGKSPPGPREAGGAFLNSLFTIPPQTQPDPSRPVRQGIECAAPELASLPSRRRLPRQPQARPLPRYHGPGTTEARLLRYVTNRVPPWRAVGHNLVPAARRERDRAGGAQGVFPGEQPGPDLNPGAGEVRGVHSDLTVQHNHAVVVAPGAHPLTGCAAPKFDI